MIGGRVFNPIFFIYLVLITHEENGYKLCYNLNKLILLLYDADIDGME